jgi:DNA-binding NarL/FixJ family response regulator
MSVAVVGQDTMGGNLLALMLKGELKCEAFGCRPSEVMSLLHASPINIVIMHSEVGAKAEEGFELAQRILFESPDMPIIFLVAQPSRDATIGAFLAGARGVFDRQQPIAQFVDCIKHVSKGLLWLGPAETKFVLDALREIPSVNALSGLELLELSDREMEVVKAAASGKTNKQIAKELRLSEHTVKNYLGRAFGKMGVTRRGQLPFYLNSRKTAARSQPSVMLKNEKLAAG